MAAATVEERHDHAVTLEEQGHPRRKETSTGSATAQGTQGASWGDRRRMKAAARQRPAAGKKGDGGGSAQQWRENKKGGEWKRRTRDTP